MQEPLACRSASAKDTSVSGFACRPFKCIEIRNGCDLAIFRSEKTDPVQLKERFKQGPFAYKSKQISDHFAS